MGEDRNKMRCPNNHFYNGNIYDRCPHCEEGTPAGRTEHIWSSQGKGVQEKNVQESSYISSKPKMSKLLWGKKKEDEVIEADKTEKTEKTESLNIFYNHTYASDEEKVEQKVEARPEPQLIRRDAEASKSLGYIQTNSLQADIARAVQPKPVNDLDEGKTVGYFSTKGSTEPPVGYLMCISGNDFGMGFPLKSGSNTIGRSGVMDVVVMDPKVSREKQMFVLYEPRKRMFLVKPGEGSGLSYYNGELLLETKQLHIYDRLEIGDTTLMLIPVCSDEFSWDDINN